MKKKKVRHVDYTAVEMLADVSGELTPVQFGVYWMICTLIYKRREAIDDDADWITGKFKRPGTDPRTVRAAIDHLVRLGKVERDDGKLMVSRCRDEIESAAIRIRNAQENGPKGGRPQKERQTVLNDTSNLENRPGSETEKLIAAAIPVPSTSSSTSSAAAEDAVPRHTDFHARFAEVSEKVLAITGGKTLLLNRVDAWLKGGANPEADIYPTLERLKPRWRSASLDFFDGAVRDAIAARNRPLGEGHDRNGTRGHRTGNGWIDAGLELSGSGSGDVDLPGGWSRPEGDDGLAQAGSDHAGDDLRGSSRAAAC